MKEIASALDGSDTIVAPATAPGRGALAIVRLAGPEAHRIAQQIMDRWPTMARSAVFTGLHDGAGVALDQAVAVRYDAPASFTGEDAVELTTHGGAVVATTVIGALIACGARLALPGEFTRRALLNGKLDVLQAEATADLVNANSRAAQRVALRQLDGGLSRRVLALRDAVIGLEALIAYDIDFPEEDDGPIAPTKIAAETNDVIHALEQLLATTRTGELVREGALVVLAGAPNAGKSSLFNALLGRARAIVTDIPGTTRDAIEAIVDTPTVPLRLVDTAGLRDAVDLVERLGIEVTSSYAARAAVVLACGESNDAVQTVMGMLSDSTAAPIVAVRTKSDQLDVSANELAALRSERSVVEALAVSAETGNGLQQLIDLVSTVVLRDAEPLEADAPVLTQERHRYVIGQALDEVRCFRERWQQGELPAPVAAVHLRTAIVALEEMIGSVDIEDVLTEVFRRFCVGK